MASNITSYEFITNKINSIRNSYPSLRNKSDDYVFSVLSTKAVFYKNPALILNETDIDKMIVDGQYDGGVDILLTDPNSETSNLIIAQSKYYKNISFDDVMNAMTKMAMFYKDMASGRFENVNEKVQRRFLSLNSEVGEESRIQFVFFTSAEQNGIRRDRIEKRFRDQFSDSSMYDVIIMFGQDIEEAIKESESRRPTVENGKINIDETDNYLLYREDAVIVNVSAFSVKLLYAQHGTNLLARNLRYHVAGRNIDKEISETIKDTPEMFWLKNNGITIICDNFVIDGKQVKLNNFSIVNGGQTTYMIHKSPYVSEHSDFYLPCKIIKTSGSSEDNKTAFSLEIAKATNSQKAIKPIDLKANSPEQVRFSQAMRDVGVFYQTKRGEKIPSAFKQSYLNTDLGEIGKLCLSAIFQMPGTSRNKPSTLYNDKYYDLIFKGNQSQIASICKELLYIDYYFRNIFLDKFDLENRNEPNSTDRITFAHNSRTICTAFVVIASRYHQKNIDDDDLQVIFNASKSDVVDNRVFDSLKDLNGFNHILPNELFKNKTDYEFYLNKLFLLILNSGITCYSIATMYEEGLNASNYLKKDKNYYGILKMQWSNLKPKIMELFDSLNEYLLK